MVISKYDLEKKYLSMNNKELAKELKISVPTLLKLIDESGITRKGSGNWHSRDSVRVI